MSPAIPRFSTFHNSRTAIPAEINSYILEYTNCRCSAVAARRRGEYTQSLPPMTSVSRDLRTAFLDIAYSSPLKSRGAAPIRFRVGEALEFDNLQTLAAFFWQGSGQDVALLRRVRFVSITYLDDQAAKDGRRRPDDRTCRGLAPRALSAYWERWCQ